MAILYVPINGSNKDRALKPRVFCVLIMHAGIIIHSTGTSENILFFLLYKCMEVRSYPTWVCNFGHTLNQILPYLYLWITHNAMFSDSFRVCRTCDHGPECIPTTEIG